MSELKARLSRYVSAAKNGQEIIITEREKPVALLRAIQRPLTDARLIDTLVRFGWGRPAYKPLVDSIVDSGQARDPDATVRRALLQRRKGSSKKEIKSLSSPETNRPTDQMHPNSDGWGNHNFASHEPPLPDDRKSPDPAGGEPLDPAAERRMRLQAGLRRWRS